MDPFADSVDHLRAELARLDVLLKRALAVARAPGASETTEEFRGLVITEPQIDALSAMPSLLEERWRQQKAEAEKLQPFDARADEAADEIEARKDLSRINGIHLALPYLADRFRLGRREIDVLLLAVAPELEARYETIYAYLQDDVTRKRPSVDLALDLVCRSERDKLAGRAMFVSNAPLVRHDLIRLEDESSEKQQTLLRRRLAADESVVAFLLDQRLQSVAIGSVLAESRQRRPSDLDADTSSRLLGVADSLRRRGTQRAIVRLIGPHDGARREASEAMAAALGRRLINVDVNDLTGSTGRVQALVRDATLLGAVVAVHIDGPRETEEATVRADRRDRRLDQLFDACGDLLFVIGPHSAAVGVPTDARLWHLDVPAPGFAVRKRTWEAALEQVSAEVDASRVADTFRFGQEQIQQTLGLATNLASLRDPANPTPSTREVLDAGRMLTTPELHRFAIRIEPRYRWPDIVLPPEKTEQLRRLASWMRYRHLVHEQWGFGRKLSRGKGLNVLFSGPPGTGKTMAAEILAGELGLDLYQIDLSTVVSKYIGQTEKQLNTIFKEAEDSQVVLCFDEADALFGKRTEVKDAHDRYANIEVNYLLQRVEQYEGMVILATNLQRNLDEAFMRRLHVVDFPPPNEERRLRIWQTHFPQEAQCGGDIDLPFLASKFKVNGGTIKNIVLAAAFRAAEAQQPIGMEHLIHATKEELQKQGKLPVKADFDRYYDLIQPKEPAV